MSWPAWYTLGVLVVMVAALVRNVARPDFVMLGALGLLLVAGVMSPELAFAGFSNEAVIAIGSLFVVAAGVERTGALRVLDGWMRPRSKSPGRAIARFFLPTALASGVLNNTPIVAMLIPRVQAWAREAGIPVAKLLIPLSTAAIVGGWLTLIGTSTNVVVHGLLLAQGLGGIHFFELAWIGVPVVILVGIYYVIFGHRLLPKGEIEELGVRARDYHFDLRVAEDASFAGKTVKEAGLRAFGSAYIAHLRRDGGMIEVNPETVLLPGDVLTFIGDARTHDSLVAREDLERTAPPVDETQGLRVSDLPLVEAVVAGGSRLIGKTLKELGFRERYGGVVLAIQRRDEPIEGGLGRVPLRAGDLLLVEGSGGIERRLVEHPEDFGIIMPLEEPRLATHRAPRALTVLAVMVGLVVFEVFSLATAAFCAALAMIVTGCLRGPAAYRSVDITVLLIIAAALGIGKGVEASGLAAVAASGVEAAGGFGIVGLLVALFLVTNVLTEVVTNTAAAALMVPVAVAVASNLGMDPVSLSLVVAVAAGASFLTPIGYQTNLMVMGAGGYRYTDYTRAGFPVSLIVLAVTVVVAMWRWV